MDILSKYGLQRVINAIGSPTIIGANVAAPEVIAAAAQALAVNVEIDALQRAASRVIAAAMGTEAGCVTSSASSALAITVAACITGPDLARIVSLPDTDSLPYEVILQLGHDVNFGARISQMVRLSGAHTVHIGTSNHADEFHLRGAINQRTAAMVYVVNGAVNTQASFIPLERAVAVAAESHIPVIVDAAAEADIRPLVRAGASLVICSGHKFMGAPTSGLICGSKDMIRACYLQNWGIGRAMKVGKESILGLMAAIERWATRDPQAEGRRVREISAILCEKLAIEETAVPHRVELRVKEARKLANALREGDPPIWVRDAQGDRLVLDLRILSPADARIVARRIADLLAHPVEPKDDVPYHDLYWSEGRLLRWPD